VDGGPALTGMRAQVIAERYGHLSGEMLLLPLIEEEFANRICLVSSFGAEAAVLLHMVAQINRTTPVLFLDTQKHFLETLRYRDALVARLGLSAVRSLAPDPEQLARHDPEGTLWSRAPDACCVLRKVEPLRLALAPFDAWISGRKDFHGGARAALPVIEVEGSRVKINPLARIPAAELAAEFDRRGLPRHPLVAAGYLSIGCEVCTARRTRADDPRSGRWATLEKTECGIHLSLPSHGL